jgi:hypothetical protein
VSIWLLAAPLLSAPTAPLLPAGTWPAGVLLAAASRLGERPVHPESPTVGNIPVLVERDLVLERDSLAALTSLLFDAGVALIEIEPGAPRSGWFASTRMGEAERPIALSVRVLRLEHADAEAVAAALNELAEARERHLPPGDIPTLFIPEPRTASIIVRTASAERLAAYLERFEELDRPAPSGEKGPVLRTYRPQRGRAETLRSAFEERWQELGGAPVTLVIPRGQNLILIRCPLQVWEAIEPILRELDLDRPEPL